MENNVGPERGLHQSLFVESVLTFVLGGISAGIGKTAAAPIERYRIIMQTQDVSSSGEREKLQIRGFGAYMKIGLKQGLNYFWRGNIANLVSYIPRQAISFVLNEKIKTFFKLKEGGLSEKSRFARLLMAGGSAGALSMAFIFPFDLIRTRLAADLGGAKNREFSGYNDCVKQIYQADGVKGFYSGVAITIPCYFLYRSIYFGVSQFTKPKQGEKYSQFAQFFQVQAIVIFAGLVAYPFDTIRRRMMMNSGRSERLYLNTIDCVNQIFQKEGFNSFYKGNVANIFRSLSGAITLFVYDELMDYIGYDIAKSKQG